MQNLHASQRLRPLCKLASIRIHKLGSIEGKQGDCTAEDRRPQHGRDEVVEDEVSLVEERGLLLGPRGGGVGSHLGGVLIEVEERELETEIARFKMGVLGMNVENATFNSMSKLPIWD